MKKIELLLGFLSFFVSNYASAQSTTHPQQTIADIAFRLPDGLLIEKVAGEDLLQWPIAATFDSQGDLVVLECHWTRETVQQQLQSKPHKIVRLHDSNQDGKFDQRHVIADSLPFPEGVVFLGDDLLVTSPPQILRLSDQDRDGFFETKSVWYDPGTITHCANDLHGPMIGPEGWIYWTKGAFAQQSLEQITAPNHALPSKAAHIYRRHPLGGPVERLMSGGMDNPSDIAFTPDGELFFCSTFLHHPGDGIRDGIAFAQRGALFGKDHQVIEAHIRTGPLMPVMMELGPAAPASIHFLKQDSISKYLQAQFTNVNEADLNQGSHFMVSSQFNLQKIGLHRVQRSGTAFEGQSIDLVSTDKIDFHPVDVLEEPNGSLLILDTGGWYDLCCPSSGSDQTIAKGGIYRLRERTLSSTSPKPDRKQDLWAWATKLTKQDLNESVRKVISDALKDPELQQIACRLAGLYRWKGTTPQITPLLESTSMPTVRTALETLGVIGDERTSHIILALAMELTHDRTLQHAATYALIELGHRVPLETAILKSESTDQQYLALLALSQLEPSASPVLFDRLLELIQSPDERIRSSAIQVLSRTPEALVLTYPAIQMAWKQDNVTLLQSFTTVLVTAAKAAPTQTLLLGWLNAINEETLTKQDWLAEVMAKLPADSLSEDWIEPTLHWMQQCRSENTTETLARVLSKWRLPTDRFDEVASVLQSKLESWNSNARVASTLLSALPMNTKLGPALSLWLQKEVVAPNESTKVLGGQSLSRVLLDSTMARGFASQLDHVSLILFQPTVEMLLRANDPEVDLDLLATLSRIPATKTITADQFSKAISNRSSSFKQRWQTTIAEAIRPSADIEKSLDDWLHRLATGDASKGHEVFKSSKAACSSCHRVGYVGGRLGPELSQIGKSRSRRNLVASIVYPNLHLAQGFYPIRVRTVNDEVFNGLLSRETDSHLELLCGVDKVCRIKKSEIEERAESNVSIMPSGLDQQLTASEFADLIAFLESKK